ICCRCSPPRRLTTWRRAGTTATPTGARSPLRPRAMTRRGCARYNYTGFSWQPPHVCRNVEWRVRIAIAAAARRGLVYAARMHALVFRQLTKVYKNGIKALKGIDLTVDEGDFFALLGPNGAGKTTAIGITTSLVNKSGGTVEVFGHDIDKELE